MLIDRIVHLRRGRDVVYADMEVEPNTSGENLCRFGVHGSDVKRTNKREI